MGRLEARDEDTRGNSCASFPVVCWELESFQAGLYSTCSPWSWGRWLCLYAGLASPGLAPGRPIFSTAHFLEQVAASAAPKAQH